MAATLADRERLAELPVFVERITGALLVVANTVGAEATGGNMQRASKRTNLIMSVLQRPADVGAYFARAAAGGSMANTFADTAGADDVKLAAISDAVISTYVSAAWDVIAGVNPWERGA